MQKMSVSRVVEISLLAIAILVVFPIRGLAVETKGIDCKKDKELVDKLLRQEVEFTKPDWDELEKIEKCGKDRKVGIADGKYKRNKNGIENVPLRFAAFLFRGMNLTGEISETNAANTKPGLDSIPLHFDTSESLRQVSFGWSQKKIAEDVIVMFSGPEYLQSLSEKHLVWKPVSWNNLLLERLTVDASVAYGRVVDFDSTIPDLDNLKTKKSWMVKVQYQIPFDKLFGLDYKNE